MLKKILAGIAFLILCSSEIRAAAPTTPATNVTFSSIDGGSLQISWINGNGARRIVIARQLAAVTAVPSNGTDYLHDDDFGLGQEIAPGEFVVYDGTGTNTVIRSLLPATQYFFAVYEYNGTGSATEYILTAATGGISTLSAPTQQPSGIIFSNVTGNSIKISWTAGNGSKRLVLGRQGSAVNANPNDLVNYNASSVFGAGQQIGTGNYVLHFSSTNTVTITGLQPNTTYHFSIFEGNGTSTPVFLTVNPAIASQLTLPAPTVASSAFTYSMIEGNSMRVSWTKGNGTRRIVVARAGSPVDALPVNGVDYLAGNTTTMPFNTAPELATGQKVVYDNVGEVADVSGLSPNTVYHFAVFEYDGTGTAISYMTSSFGSSSRSTATTPTVQASGLVFSNVSGNSMKLTWTNGNGSKRIVIARAGAAVDAQPVDLANYSGQAQFGLGTQIGSGNYVVFSGASNTVTVTALALNQTYHFAVFEANGNSYPVYAVLNPATGSQATTDRPTIASASMSFSEIEGDQMKLQWTSGNGQKRIVVVSENTPVTAVPVDGTDYLAGISSAFDTAPEIAPGQKVVYDNTGNQLTLTGLTAGNTYHYRIYEYSGTGATIAYLTTSFATGSQSTLSAPVVPASNVQFSNITGNALTISWTNGDGARRLVIAKAGAPVDAAPVTYSTYSSSSVFGTGTQIGSGNYFVGNTTGNSITVTNLNINTTYHFAIYEANGVNGPVYLTSSFATGSQVTADRPTVAPSGMSFSNLDGNAMRVAWTNGNGQRRIVIARAGSPVDAVPADGVDYLATGTSAFNTAPEIAPGQKVIFDNTGTYTDLTGLSPNTVYYFRVYEYSVGTSGNAYLTSAFASGNKNTLSHPTVQASGMAFTSVTSSSMIVSWTSGNGSGRIILARQGAPVNVTPSDLSEYVASSNFGSGTQIGSGNFVVAKNNGTSFTLNSLTPGTTYHFAVFEYNGSSGPLYLVPGSTGQATTIGPPTTAASSAFVSHVTTGSLQLNWTNGSGNKRLVLMKQGSPVDATPVNNASYFANSFFGSGSEIGTGNFVVFNGIQDFVTVTNLQPATSYHFAIFEYNDFGSTSQYLVSSTVTANSVTGALPVSLTDFRAATEKDGVRLDWSTGSEENSSHFEVEHSSDGVAYSRIGNVQAAGQSQVTRQYAFVHASPEQGYNYYRLKMMDIDGKWSYSRVIRVSSNSNTLVKWFTNPVQHMLHMEGGSESLKNGSVTIYDLSGRMMKKERITGPVMDINVAQLPGGMYIALVEAGGKKQSLRFNKQ